MAQGIGSVLPSLAYKTAAHAAIPVATPALSSIKAPAELALLPVRHVTNSSVVALVQRLFGATTLDVVYITDGVFQKPALPILQLYARQNGHVVDAMPSTVGVDAAACGSSSLAATLERFGLYANTEGIDEHLREPMNLGGSLYAGCEYLHDRGLAARHYCGGSWSDLQRGLTAGYGLIVTLSHETSVHTMIVTGMFRGGDGNEYIEFQDWQAGHCVVMSRQDFECSWASSTLGGVNGGRTGITNTYALVAPAGTRLPPDGGSVWAELNGVSALTTLDGFHALVSGAAHMSRGEVLGGLAGVIAGTIECACQLGPTLLQAAGMGPEWCGDRLLELAKRVVAAGFWGKLSAALLLLIAFPLKLMGVVLRAAGQLVGAATGVCARLLSWPVRQFSNWMHADNDACNQVRHCDPCGNTREIRNFQRLVLSPALAKIDLIQTMLAGVVGEDERRMILRTLAAARASGQLEEVVSRLVVLGSVFAETDQWLTLVAPPEKTVVVAPSVAKAAPVKLPTPKLSSSALRQCAWRMP